MNRTLITQHSAILDRDFDVIVYGEGGYPVVAFPTMEAPATDFEDFGMTDALSELVDGGRVQLFCLSTCDEISFGAEHSDLEWRAAMQEAYFTYVTEEALPLVRELSGSDRLPLAVGVDTGATHAAVVALRRPDLWAGCVALSGEYDARDLFDDFSNEDVYANSPAQFLAQMPADHEYVEAYRQRTLVFCCGQGQWEEDSQRTQGVLAEAFARLGVDATCDWWGWDVGHNWYWWCKEMAYLLPLALDDVQAKLAAAAEAEPVAEVEVAAAAEAEPVTEVPAPAEEPVVAEAAAPAPAAPAEPTPAAKKATTRRSSAKRASTKAAAAASEPTEAVTEVAAPAAKKTTRRSTKKAAEPAPADVATTEAAATEAAPAEATSAPAKKKTTRTRATTKRASATTAKKAAASAATEDALSDPAEPAPAAQKTTRARKASTTKKASGTTAKKSTTRRTSAKKAAEPAPESVSE